MALLAEAGLPRARGTVLPEESKPQKASTGPSLARVMNPAGLFPQSLDAVTKQTQIVLGTTTGTWGHF